MTLKIDLDLVCLVCLQEGSLQSVFNGSDDISYAEKLIKCSEMYIGNGMPDKICETCAADLDIVYCFQQNCEKTKTILKSLLVQKCPDVIKEKEDFVEREKKLQESIFPIRAENVQVTLGDNANAKSAEFQGCIDQIAIEVKDQEAKRGRGRPRKTKEVNTKANTRRTKVCDICGQHFKYAIHIHMRRHRNERPFKCEYCEKRFVSRNDMICHERVHTKIKPYACQYCGRTFSDYGSRIKHERTHTGERPYACSTCGKTFAYANVLSVHIRSHTGEKSYHCEVCGKGYSRKSYLINHMKIFHSNSDKLVSRFISIKPVNLDVSQHEQITDDDYVEPCTVIKFKENPLLIESG